MLRKTLALAVLLAFAAAQDDAIDEANDAIDEAADDFGEDGEDLLDEAEDAAEDVADDVLASDAAAVVESAAEVVGAPKTLAEEKEEEDLWVLLIGISACVDTLWWLLFGWFIYLETNTSDSTMCVNSDCLVKMVPIAWFWNSLSHATLSWTALTYFWVWLFYMLISIPELVFWVMYMIGEPELGTWLFQMWVQWPGLYGSWILYFFPMLFPLIQLTAVTGINQPGYSNAALQMAMFTISWLYTGLVHVLGYPYVIRMYEKTQAPKEAEAVVAVVEEVVEEFVEEEEEEEEEEDEDTDEAF